MSHATAFSSLGPPLPAPVRKVGAPLAAIIGLGTLVGLILSLLTAVDPGGTVLGFALSSLAMTCVLLCYLWLDRWEPEPPRLLVLAFLWGASVAVVLSVAFEHVIEQSFGLGGEKPSFVTVAIGAPVIEEAAKGAFLLLMMTGRRRAELNTMTDCLIYAGFTAVGFSWLENIFYIASGETVAGSLAIAGMRLVLGPFAHPLFTTMIGIGVYFALQQRSLLAKAGFLLLGYLAAVVMHGLWNGSALLGASTYLGVYVLWMMPIFGLAITLAVVSRRRERHIIASKLPGLVAHGLVTPPEATWLGSLQSRKTAVSNARRFGGRRAAWSVKRFTMAVVELAYVRDRIDRGFGDDRVFALQNEEAHRLVAARADAGPALHLLNGYRFPVR
ncbi:MAG: PrsW family intramembrane metalloprotease [Actinomycetota bacterium]|nr:PrsW family intramembrane metalloprotease [Actinomycetota bacterium]MDA2947599.1 PrsW family intramembrane metalloprotease [Actinomycetota bacterium]MDA2990190.1 PrsW family intramembrane metalloprotease [Actinomycetota bacterium]